jgi:serine/threonine protein kinase
VSSQPGIEFKRSKYRLLGLVGQGQFGRVFCAAHRQTGRLVALKNLDRQRFPTHQFLRELRFLLSLQHPNIVTCQTLEHTPTGRCLVMDYCEGGTLRNLMTEGSSLNLPQSLKLVMDILAGLEHAHSRGIVHCDIKPENILLNIQLKGWTARISDFGIARLSQEAASEEIGNTGSPAYMAPERFYGQYSLTSDLYAVGILFFELIAGHRPFSGTPAELMSAHLNAPVKMPGSIPEVWRPVILTALQKLSARRFRSAGDMLFALRAIAATEGLGSEVYSDAIHLPLRKPSITLPQGLFQSQRQEILRQPLTDLAIANPSGSQASASSTLLDQPAAYLYRAAGKQVTFQMYKTGILASASSASPDPFQPEIWHVTPLRSAVCELLPRPQGCFVVTRQAVYLIPSEIETDPSLSLQLILEGEEDCVAAIEAQGRWLATLTTHSEAESSTLAFRQLPSVRASMSIASHPILLSVRRQFPQSLQLFALDARHVAIVAGLPVKETALGEEGSGTLVKVMTRRGSRVGSLILPIQIGQAILTPTPYRLLATERSNPQSLLLIDLKPYRVFRLAVDITPTLLAATAWGYIVADAQGRIVLLDQDGGQVGRIHAPDHMTAIASFNQYGLLIATWDGAKGSLYTLDLRELEVDLLF